MTELTHRLSKTVRDLPPSGIRRFFDLASQMQDVISLGVGEPDFVTPWHVREASIYALERGFTSYTANSGLLELRREISRYLRKFELDYDPETEILVTVGGSEAIDLALRTLLEPGEEVLIPEPTYVSYRPCAVLAGGTPVVVPTGMKDDFRLTKEALVGALTAKTKVLVMSYPNNPTGAVMGSDDLKDVAELIMTRDFFVVTDEIYAELSYGEPHHSIAAIPGMKERTILVSGLSKAYAMTGWRVGYVAAPREIMQELIKIHQYTILCAPVMGQMAAIEAFRHGDSERDKMVESYNERRRLMVNGFKRVGLDCHEPKGAFYAFPSIASTGLTSEQFAEGLLKEGKVAVVPGHVFGESGEGFIRASYATSVEQIEKALERMDRFVQKLQPQQG